MLQSKIWDTRIAAAQAIDFICKLVPSFQPIPDVYPEDCDSVQLTLEEFDILQVTKNGSPLEAMGVEEFNIDFSKLKPKERLQAQRQMLKKNLGLGDEEELSIVSKDLEKRVVSCGVAW